jgi:hypothetical protein
MALIINNNVTASEMAPVVRGVLDKADALLIPGKTFTDEYNVNSAGQIEVAKIKFADIDVALPGADFPEDTSEESVVQIPLNNAFPQQKRLPAMQASAVPFDKKLACAEQMTNKALKARNVAAIGKLVSAVAPATNANANAKVVACGTDGFDKANIQHTILALAGKVADEGLHADVVFLGNAAYQAFKESLGSNYTPTFNDAVVRDGEVTSWMGLTVCSTNLLQKAVTYKFKNAEGTTVSVANVSGNGLAEATTFDKLGAIVYDHRVLAVIDALNTLRVVDSEKFNGSIEQLELTTGFGIVSDVDEANVAEGIALGFQLA